MRKTTAIHLTLLSAASLAMVGCGDDRTSQDTMFADEAACIQAYGSDGEAACRETFRAAAAEHQATAPRFADVAACESQTGGTCQVAEGPKPGMASVILPVMAGVLIGRALSDNSRPVMPLYGGRPGCPPGAPATPECQPRSSSSGTSGGRFSWYYAGSQVGTSDTSGGASRVSTNPQGAATLARVGTTGTVSRGGLGSAGRGFASASS